MTHACVLDTHAWIILMQDPDRLPTRARRFLQGGMTLHVPGTCLREVAWLWHSGHIAPADAGMSAERWMRMALADPCELAPVSPAIAVCAAALGDEGFHRDPSDRHIYATARVMNVPLITGDTAIRAFEKGLPRKAKRLAVWA